MMNKFEKLDNEKAAESEVANFDFGKLKERINGWLIDDEDMEEIKDRRRRIDNKRANLEEHNANYRRVKSYYLLTGDLPPDSATIDDFPSDSVAEFINSL